jgi:nucleotide-binding universal stress UspA family protein
VDKKKILVPLDGSGFSHQILPQIQRLMNPADAELILLQVGPIPHATPLEPVPATGGHWLMPMDGERLDPEMVKHPIYASQLWESHTALLENALMKNALSLERGGFSVSVAARLGDPAHEILRFIDEHDIDLVAMTSHGRTGLKRFIFGSVAEEVLHHVSIPVMVLHPLETMQLGHPEVMNEVVP